MAFGDAPPPADRTAWVYAIRSDRCGHVVDVVPDIAKTAAQQVADRIAAIPFVVEVERMTREEAQAETGSCGACRAPDQDGFGL